MNPARLLLPAVRWSSKEGFAGEWPVIEEAIGLGVGGFILFGGSAGEVRDLTARMANMSRHSLLIGSDLERGAGQQFAGATSLPPAAALGSLGDLDVIREAAALTAREARAVGVNWIFAPVADVDLEPSNPILGSRAFGTDPVHVARSVAAWIDGCRAGGALSCAKHFPGHGRTLADSHLQLPTVSADRASLEEDLVSFRASVAAEVDSMMTAHVAYPALDASGAPATLSHPILTELLRRDMAFDGIVVSDALVMHGLLEATDEAGAAVLALRAGCDALLYPENTAAVAAALNEALARGDLEKARVAEALARIERAVASVRAEGGGEWGLEADQRWALETAVQTLSAPSGSPRVGGRVELIEIDDDQGGALAAPSRAAFVESLHESGVELGVGGAPLIALYCEPRAWKGRAGLSQDALARLTAILELHPDASVVLFGHPRLTAALPGIRNLVVAWGGEPLMQRAAATYLTRRAG